VDPFADPKWALDALGPSSPAPSATPVPESLGLNLDLELAQRPKGNPFELSPAETLEVDQGPPLDRLGDRRPAASATRAPPSLPKPPSVSAARQVRASPVAVVPPATATRKSRPRTAWSSLMTWALPFMAVALLGWSATSYRFEQSQQSAKTALSVVDLSSGYYPTREGRSLYVVRGRVLNPSLERLGPVKVIVELRRGSSLARRAEGYVGAMPSPEALYSISSSTALASLVPQPTGADRFLVVFYEYPEDLAEHTVKVIPQAEVPRL
jgi:hypothetical protein